MLLFLTTKHYYISQEIIQYPDVLMIRKDYCKCKKNQQTPSIIYAQSVMCYFYLGRDKCKFSDGMGRKSKK